MNRISRLIAGAVIVLSTPKVSFAFNLWTDVEQQTQWTLGSSVAGGTAMALRHDDASGLKAGQFVGSALAQVANYRLLSLWAGGNFIPQSDHTLKAIETAKVGINLGYLLKGFKNQPPEIIKNLVFGPSLTMPIWTTPHTVIPFFDLNYAFAGPGGAAGTAGSTPPTVIAQPTATSRLNLIPLAMDDMITQKG